MILSIKTDTEESGISLFENDVRVNEIIWKSGRQLSLELLPKINELLNRQNCQLIDLKGIVFFAGPGSFTGLRIGATIAETLAYTLKIPMVSTSGKEWVTEGLNNLKTKPEKNAVISYGRPARITKQKK